MGFGLKIHAEFTPSGGGAGRTPRAVSADHLVALDVRGIAAPASSTTVATLLPGTSFFLTRTSRARPRARGRRCHAGDRHGLQPRLVHDAEPAADGTARLPQSRIDDRRGRARRHPRWSSGAGASGLGSLEPGAPETLPSSTRQTYAISRITTASPGRSSSRARADDFPQRIRSSPAVPSFLSSRILNRRSARPWLVQEGQTRPGAARNPDEAIARYLEELDRRTSRGRLSLVPR